MGRALAPIDQAISQWKMFVRARRGSRSLQEFFATTPVEEPRTALPEPEARLEVTGLTLGAPGSRTPIVRNVAFDVKPGEAVGVIGPSASGKSTLARADEREIVLAAERAGAHELILKLPNGYDTEIGESGGQLSGGQRQRIGLARALFGDPQLLVFDEPNANLDAEGEQSLVKAIIAAKERGRAIIVMAHRPSAIAACDRMDSKFAHDPKRWGGIGYVLTGLVVIVGAFGGLMLWSTTAELEGAVVAQGELRVESKAKPVQHREGGVVGAIFVKEGDLVKAGDPLVRLDPTTQEASFEIVDAQLIEALARKARLLAERDEAGDWTAPQ